MTILLLGSRSTNNIIMAKIKKKTVLKLYKVLRLFVVDRYALVYDASTNYELERVCD